MSKPKSRILAIVFITAGILILTVGLGFILSFNANPDHPQLPNKIAELPISNLTTGQQALYEINQLHGKSFPLVTGSVGTYGLENQVIIWVAAAADESKASEILKSMHDRIAEGKSPFLPTDDIPYGNRTVYILEGLGQKHFYFRSRELIVWTAVNADLYQAALQQVLDYYP